MFTTIMLLVMLIAFVKAPHVPGCLPAESVLVTGRDKGLTTLTLVHGLGQTSAALFKSKQLSKALSTIISGIQRVYPVSYYCGICFGSYVQCGALTEACNAECDDDFSTDACKACVAGSCGLALLRCTRATFAFPEVEI
jgi:hypothetical protein